MLLTSAWITFHPKRWYFASNCFPFPLAENICYGPFLRLPRESQELSLCCLYYFSHLDLPFLKSLAGCCLSKFFMLV